MTFRLPLCLGLLVPVLTAQEAPDPMKWIPRRAGMVIVLNRPGTALARWDKLGERLKSKEMALVRQALTQDFGGLPLLDPDAPLVEFIIPAPAAKTKVAPNPEGREGMPSPKPQDIEFRILAFQKKEAFQARFKPVDMAKAATDVTLVTVGGKPMVAAVRGHVAILGPKDSGPMLKALLADKGRFALPPESEAAWAMGQDVAFMFSIEALKDRKQPASAKEPAAPPLWSPLAKLSDVMKTHPERELSSFVIGLRLSEAGDFTASLRLGVAPGGELARLTAGMDQGAGPAFRGIPAAPFALAFGMDFPQAWVDTMALAVVEEAKKDPKADAAAVVAMQGLFRELRGIGMVLSGAKEGAPLASGLGLAMTVGDAKAFLGQATALAGRPGEGGAPGMRTATAKFQGRAVTTFTRVPPPPPKDGKAGTEAPSMMPPPEALFGSKDVKTSLLMADDHTIIAGFGDPQATFQAGLDSLGRSGFGQMARLQRTRDLLGAGGRVGHGVLYLSLPETLQMVSAFFPVPVHEADLKQPVPPLGVSLNITSARIEVNAALPSETLALIGKLAGAAAEMRKAPKE